jgi:hypothetical protein
MEDAFELDVYMPLSFKTTEEQEYIQFLWEAFESNCEQGKYQFAFIAYHMLTMSFMYFSIWRIKQNEQSDFQKATIGFAGRDLDGLVHKDDSDDEKRWSVSPFNFSKANERSIIRILALIGCDKSKIGRYIQLVDQRNDTAHSNGKIHFSDQGALDNRIREILRVVDEIQTHTRPIIERCYKKFLLESHDPEDREYPDDRDQIREILFRRNYFSHKDIDVCLAYDLAPLAAHAHYSNIEALHKALMTLRDED